MNKIPNLISISLFFALVCSHAQIEIISPKSEKEHFNSMANYLVLGSGKWTAKNERQNANNPGSAEAFGLWFERPLPNLMTLTVVAYLGDSTRISSQGIFSWHPGNQHYIYVTSDRGGGYSEGVSEFKSDSTFTSVMKIYRPNGRIFDHKDENFIVNENQHRNTSFSKDADGQWKATSKWVWTRDPEDN